MKITTISKSSRQLRKTKSLRLGALIISLLFSACSSGGGSDNGGGNPNTQPPQIAQVRSSALSDSDNVYPTGRVVRIDIDESAGVQLAGGTIRITSGQGYDLGVQNLLFGSIYYIWDTAGLSPGDYTVTVTLTNAAAQTTTSTLTITLAPNTPAINKLVSDVDVSVPAVGLPVSVGRTYLLDSTFDGPMGYGWTHTYRMRAVETPANRINESFQLIPIDGVVQIFNADGTGSHFLPNGDGTYTPPKGDFRTLTKASDGTYALVEKSGVRFDFDAIGRLTRITDRNGNRQTLAYGANGRVATVTDASGQVTRFTYNANSRISSIANPAGRTVSYGYDSSGNLVSVTKPGGFTTQYAYDANHNLTTITDPAGRQTFFTSDAEDRLASVSGAGGENRVSFEYGVPSANTMTVTDATGNETVFTYDNNASITQVTDPLGNVTRLAYDTDLNLTSVTDTKGGSTSFTYDARGNVLTTTDAQGNVVTMTYAAPFDQVASLTDAKGNITAFGYDARRNLSSMTYPNGAAEIFAYNAFGNLISKTDRKVQTITYSYDVAGRLTRKGFPDGTSDTFTYDSRGNLSGATDEMGTIAFAYDSADRLTSVTYPGGEVVSYSYDPAGNRMQLTYPDGMKLDYAYDALGRMTEISESSQMVARYAYDALSRVVRRELQNGTFSRYSYDTSSRLLDLINSKSTSEIISRFTYTYDSVGNRTSMTTLAGTTQYGYDAINQLVSVTNPDSSTTTYNLDPSGNRTSVADANGTTNYSTNDVNQYTSVGGDTFTYDANGNMTSKTDTNGATGYIYDLENRLIRLVTPFETVSYTYDPFGKRSSKTNSTGTVKYIHDGFRVILEKDEIDKVVSYIYGMGIDEVLVMTRGSVQYFYSQDGIGSVTNLTNSSESIIESYEYDPYGMPNIVSSKGNPYLFTGREYEPESGLYFFRARYYNPTDGRFHSTDPVGLLAGLNFYSYVNNNPVRWTDPLGLYLVETIGVGGRPVYPMVPQFIENAGLIGLLVCSTPVGRIGCSVIAVGATFYIGQELYYASQGSSMENAFNNPPDPAQSKPSSPAKFPPDGGCIDMETIVCNFGFPGNLGAPWAPGDPGGPGDPGCQDSTNICTGDPTFVQVLTRERDSTSKNLVHKVLDRKPGASSSGLVAEIAVPYEDALVRGEIPVFGLAHGYDFKKYRVEYGQGKSPTEWQAIMTSPTPKTEDVSSEGVDDSGDTTIRGNLATWDTGLSYVYLPSHPAGHPIDLKGTYTIRLLVTAADGRTIEDRVTVDVADVIPNAWGGTVISTDKRLTLTVPEQAIRDSFRLIVAQPARESAPTVPADRTLVGSVYELREPGERFTKEVKVAMQLTEEDINGRALDSIGIYSYNAKRKTWKHLDSRRSGGRLQIETAIRELRPYYALMASEKPGEGSATVTSNAEPIAVREILAVQAFGPHLINEDFEQELGGWSNRDGDVGATVTAHKVAGRDGSKTLKVTNTRGGGNFAVNVGVPAFDAREYPIVQFDYRISPSVKTNLLVKVAGRWYDIGFTDDPKELHDKRVNIAHIGDIAGIRADDQWHTAQLNLYDMLQTKTGNTIVEEMIMADWDVPGYMKLTFGKNPKGATYFIDNFSISRDEQAGRRLAVNSLTIDHFNQQRDTNALGEPTTTYSDGTSGWVVPTFAEEGAGAKGTALKLSYDVSKENNYAGYVSSLGDLDAREFQGLSFALHGLADGEDVLVGLKDRAGHEQKVPIRDSVSSASAGGWRKVHIPLARFTHIEEWDGLENVSVAFENTLTSRGTVLLDDLELQKDLAFVAVDNFEDMEEGNLLAGPSRVFAKGLAEINGTHVKNSPNGVYQIAYGGTIGIGEQGVKSFAGWETELNGVDCSRCDALTFRIKGANGGENPGLYLDDGNFRWAVEVAHYAQVSTSWQTVTVPLRAFSEYGVDLTHLEKLQVVFEGVPGAGSILLDDIRLGPATH